MFLFRLFRSFLPLHNPIGFGASDFIELALAAMLVLLVLARARIEPWGRRLAERTGWCMLVLAALPIVLRLALLPHHPVPTPRICDEFSYLLLADTLAHFRLANPTHPMHAFFEALFVQQEPRYASIYPLGQGIVLALGRMIFGHPWAGVALSVGALCALCYWMLRAWTTPGWALTGGLLAVFTFGPLNLWMNGYWGGAVSAVAGCLVFGALPRLRDSGRTRDAVWLGLGLGLQLLSRPFEFLFLAASVLVFGRQIRRRLAAVAMLALLPAAGLMLLQNKAVTGSWTTLPYVLSRYQYGMPTTFTFQPNPTPHRPLNQEQRVDYELQSDIHGRDPETPARYLRRLADRVRFYRFFFLAPLYVALPAFLLRLRDARLARVLLCLLIFSLGANFYPYFYPHYIAAAACLFVLVAVTALERLGAQGRARDRPALCGAFSVLVRPAPHRQRATLEVRTLGQHRARRSRRPRRHRSPPGAGARQATGLRPLRSEAPAGGVGAQCRGYRQRARRLGKRPGRRGKCEAPAILSRSQSMAAGAGRETAENFNVSMKTRGIGLNGPRKCETPKVPSCPRVFPEHSPSHTVKHWHS